MFNHDKLDVYRLAVRYDELLCRILPKRGFRWLRDQAEQASGSVMANIAEGAGRWRPGEKRHFYGIARGSATESAAHLDALKNRKLVQDIDYDAARILLLSIVK